MVGDHRTVHLKEIHFVAVSDVICMARAGLGVHRVIPGRESPAALQADKGADALGITVAVAVDQHHGAGLHRIGDGIDGGLRPLIPVILSAGKMGQRFAPGIIDAPGALKGIVQAVIRRKQADVQRLGDGAFPRGLLRRRRAHPGSEGIKIGAESARDAVLRPPGQIVADPAHAAGLDAVGPRKHLLHAVGPGRLVRGRLASVQPAMSGFVLRQPAGSFPPAMPGAAAKEAV